MKKTMHTLSALTIAAALAMFATACTNKDLLDNPTQTTQPQNILVTVGAGISDAATRSAVVPTMDIRLFGAIKGIITVNG